MASLSDLPRPVKTYHSQAYARISPGNTGFDGKDKTILVTGGASGVGLSIATSFANAGVRRIIITSRSPGPQADAKKAIQASYPDVEVLTFQAPLSDTERMDEIMRAHGPVDVLVLCAFYANEHKPLDSLPTTAIAECFQTNVMANLDLVKSYLGQPVSVEGGKTIINVSTAATHIFLPHQIGYGPSKAAFTQMISRLTAEHTPDKGVRMCSYHPGAFYTPSAKAAGVPLEAFAWEDIKLAGDFAVWLAGPQSAFLNGRFVWAQWDVDELVALKERIESDPTFLQLGLQQ